MTLQQFNALAQMHRLEQLTVDPQGNPVVNFTLWKYYVLFRLNHFNLQKINGVKVGQCCFLLIIGLTKQTRIVFKKGGELLIKLAEPC